MKLGAHFVTEQPIDHTHAAGGVVDVQHRMLVLGSNLHRRMLGAGGGSADQQRQLEFESRHFLGDMDHFVQTGRDQPGEAN